MRLRHAVVAAIALATLGCSSSTGSSTDTFRFEVTGDLERIIEGLPVFESDSDGWSISLQRPGPVGSGLNVVLLSGQGALPTTGTFPVTVRISGVPAGSVGAIVELGIQNLAPAFLATGGSGEVTLDTDGDEVTGRFSIDATGNAFPPGNSAFGASVNFAGTFTVTTN